MTAGRADLGDYGAQTRMVWQISDLMATKAMAVEELLDAACVVICREIADVCVVGVLFDEGRKIHPLGLSSRDPERQRKLDSVSEWAWEPVDGDTQRILELEAPELLSAADLEDALRSRPWGEIVLAGSQLHTALLAPMRAFGERLGAVWLARSLPRPAFAPDEVPFVQDVGHRLALAIHALHLAEELARVSVASAGAESAAPRFIGLTTREREILGLIRQGLSSREIAELLYLSVRTVEWHRARLMVKVGASKRSELIAIARMIER